MKPRRQLNRYTQRELEDVIAALEAWTGEHRGNALAKSRLRLRKEKDRAK